MRSCITYAVACDGAAVTTIEGLDDDEIAKELRQAFSREHALQCGYCTPGVLISARDLAVRSDRADEREIRIAMSGNLCRCTGYVGIIRAITSVIESRRTRGIAAIPDAGRRTMGPAGSGHAKTAGPSNVQPSGATGEDVAASRHGRSGTRHWMAPKAVSPLSGTRAFMAMSFQHSRKSNAIPRIRRLGLTEMKSPRTSCRFC